MRWKGTKDYRAARTFEGFDAGNANVIEVDPEDLELAVRVDGVEILRGVTPSADPAGDFKDDVIDALAAQVISLQEEIQRQADRIKGISDYKLIKVETRTVEAADLKALVKGLFGGEVCIAGIDGNRAAVNAYADRAFELLQEWHLNGEWVVYNPLTPPPHRA